VLTIPKWLLPLLLRLHAWAMTRPYYDLGPANDRYMLRGWLLGYHCRSRNEKRDKDVPQWHGRDLGRLHAWITDRLAIRAHVTLRSDHDRALHCHPVSAISVVLEGGYWEVGWPNSQCTMFPATYAHVLAEIKNAEPAFSWVGDPARFNIHWRAPGTIVYRTADTPHRLVLPPGTVSRSFWIMGRRQRRWGFYPGGKFVPAAEYLQANQ
jgi:hypothetical protein